ncbi:hypothetical protein B0H16DRAFT_1476493 [Mycena metata]|uniref:Uncharacterized protein n=1 Tax=Mycena metata TaxID=1033252 RepID=A0AAD7MGV5_9AGAR|nr:hypothetical protein B0H16DRAFT_1476493 [Mycena metata]
MVATSTIWMLRLSQFGFLFSQLPGLIVQAYALKSTRVFDRNCMGKKIASVRALLDLSASESEGRQEDNSSSALSDVTEHSIINPHDSDAPLIVGDNMGAKSDDEPVEVSGPTPVKRKRLQRRAVDSDEEVPVLDGDDSSPFSMYSKTSGLKSGLLGPPLQTRSSTIATTADNVLKNTLPSKKRRRKNKSIERTSDGTGDALPVATKDRAISWSPTPPPGWRSSNPTEHSTTGKSAISAEGQTVRSESPIGTESTLTVEAATRPETTMDTSTVAHPTLLSGSIKQASPPENIMDTRMDRIEFMFQAQNAQLQQLMTMMATREAPTGPAAIDTSGVHKPTALPLDSPFKEGKPAARGSVAENKPIAAIVVCDCVALNRDGWQSSDAPQTPKRPQDKGKARAQASDDDLNIPDDFKELEFDIISVFSPKKNKSGVNAAEDPAASQTK